MKSKNYSIREIVSSDLNISDDFSFYTMVFINDKIGFIAGRLDSFYSNPDKQSTIFGFQTSKALIFKTVDGGYKWEKSDLGNGYISEIWNIDSTLYALRKSCDRSSTVDSCMIYYSIDKGKKWNIKYVFPGNVNNFFVCNGYAYIFNSDSTHDYLSSIKMDSNTNEWEKHNFDLEVMSTPIVKDNLMYFLSTNDYINYNKNLIVVYDLLNHTRQTILINQSFEGRVLTYNDNKINAVGMVNNYLMVYSLINNSMVLKYSYEDEDYFPIGFHTMEHEDWLVIGKRTTIDVTHSLLHVSLSDKNKTFENVDFIKDNEIQPFCFFTQDKKIKAWFYSGHGKIQVLERSK